MKQRILVTGAGGFVGANLVRKLIGEQYIVHAFVKQQSNLWRLNDIKKKIIFHPNALQNKSSLSKLVKKISPSVIYHLATYGAYPIQQDFNEMVDTNIRGTYNLLESLKDIPYSQLIITGSSSEYGKKEKVLKESDLLEPNNLYAVTKATATHLAQSFAKSTKKPLIIFRLLNVYGPYEEKGRLVRNVIIAALTNSPILLATGKEARDFIYIDDVVDAYLYAKNKTKLSGEIFNIGTGKQTSIYQLANLVKKITNSSSKIKKNYYEGRPWDTFFWKADMHKTHALLGWKAKTTLIEGISQTILWQKKTKIWQV